MDLKREIVTLVPYYFEDYMPYFFLQVRDSSAPRLPGFLGFFGGAIENGETPEIALEREIWEELELRLERQYRHFVRFESFSKVNNVFVMAVANNFSEMIVIREGDGGRFISAQQVIHEPKICDSDRLVLIELTAVLCGHHPD